MLMTLIFVAVTLVAIERLLWEWGKTGKKRMFVIAILLGIYTKQYAKPK